MEFKIKQSEKERKELSGIRKLARERAKKKSSQQKLKIVKSILTTKNDRRRNFYIYYWRNYASDL